MFDFRENTHQNLFLFYDLETSGRHPMNQIMSAFFVLTDDTFKEIPEYELNIKVQLSPLELPEPEAILVNKLSPSAQQTESISEYQACLKIVSLVEKVLSDFPGSAVYLTGFNSNRFDLPFLRTTLIRNGISPYFSGKLRYADILEYVRDIAFHADNFEYCTKISTDGYEIVTFNLESLGKRYGLLNQEQEHDSREDTNLLISVTQHLSTLYPESLTRFLNKPVPEKPFEYYKSFSAENGQILKKTSYANVHCRRGNSLLYVDLEKYLEDQSASAMSYLNVGQGGFHIKSMDVPPDMIRTAENATKQFRSINLFNFFQVSDCDIEQDIYRLPIQLIDALGKKIRGELEENVSNQDFRRLYRRYILRNFQSLETDTQLLKNYEVAFREYVISRYVSGLKLNKFGNDAYSRSFSELLSTAEHLAETLEGADKELMKELKEFYLNSQIYTCVLEFNKTELLNETTKK